MQHNFNEILGQGDAACEDTACTFGAANAGCIEAIDNDVAIDPNTSKMEKTNSLGKMFQRFKSSSKKYQPNSASAISKLDEVDSIDIEQIPGVCNVEKTNSLGKMFQRMRSSGKKVQQKRPATAACSSSSTKGSYFKLLVYILYSWTVRFFFQKVFKISYVVFGKRIRKYLPMRLQSLMTNLKTLTLSRLQTTMKFRRRTNNLFCSLWKYFVMVFQHIYLNIRLVPTLCIWK